MDASHFLVSLLNGLSLGLLLFMLAAGLTLIFSLMGVLNFAHASFYMLGAYVAYSVTQLAGFWTALLLAPLLVGLAGAAFERHVLRRVHAHGHVSELLVTFGLAYVVLELVQLAWGRQALDFGPPPSLRGPLFTLVDLPGSLSLAWGAAPEVCRSAGAVCTQFPAFRAFGMAVALGMLLAVWLLLRKTRVGLVIQAALTHPQMVEALGHDVPRVFMLVFGGGTALAALAGVIGGALRVTEPAMAQALGPVVFAVIVIGGMGSLAGAFVASLLLGVLDSFAVGSDHSLADLLRVLQWPVTPESFGWALWSIKLSQVAAILPYLLLVLVLVLRPRGLLGRREG
ncbi:branched-chain amino acid ABC transporter permease [Rubrivivax gelatinosus]|uniref:Amino acid/amide ABC transporter membrane protein 1 (HAAT family) n=1 Tax=Rubrivivax gelatinosus TaxID=28068 RepID=A0A4R2MGB9_RUBGE|nr:branched-chain amino acid ABC transporter permease [Rubrivivax gelatinosus]MBK1686466.1 branched-chain amino acid ABC transporter permease [Rubrivivax gelatinosus]TCP04305.1 amino acid/amide ABC transporter membrane protein 1 (HAAT family) [Rubrivivax gelatinosus]